ncbi:hypothetical protein XENOCAPTIV_030924, partial [Xenoophorus captivus]
LQEPVRIKAQNHLSHAGPGQDVGKHASPSEGGYFFCLYSPRQLQQTTRKKSSSAACPQPESDFSPQPGKKPGLQIWRVEKMDLVPVPSKLYGDFYTGDAYIILYTTSAPSYNVHSWIVDVTMVCFLQQGGVASGFKHVVTNDMNVKRLLHVKGRRTVRATEVSLSWASFNRGDCFIIDLGKFIKEKKYSPRTKVQIIPAGSETTLFKQFFSKWLEGQTTGQTYTVGRIAKVEKIPFDASKLHGNNVMAAQHGMVDDGSGKVQVRLLALQQQ